MKKFVLCILAVLPVLLSAAKEPASLTVMSFNIRNASLEGDGTNDWSYRFGAVGLMFEDKAPDVAALQEPTSGQVEFFRQNFRGYKSVGVGRDDGKKAGEHTAIVYNSKKISLGRCGTFWLSETPDKPSAGFGVEQPRSVVWAVLKDKKSGSSFLIVNTHLDEAPAEAQQSSLDLILQKVNEINKDSLPVIFCGSFNLEENDAAFTKLSLVMRSARGTAAQSTGGRTYHGWGRFSRVTDHIWVRDAVCTVFETVTDRYDGRAYVSDHCPVMATVVF